MKFLAYIAIIFLFVSCSKHHGLDCFKGTGADITENRAIGEFSHISIQDKFETHVYQSPQHRVEVICGKHVIDNIKTLVRNDTLFVSNENRCNFVRGYKREIRVNIYTPHIVYMVNEAVGVVHFDGAFKQDSIHARVANSGDFHLDGEFKTIKTTSSGNGDMYIKGRCNRLFVFTTGINFVNTNELRVKDYMFIHTVTIGDCNVNADSVAAFNFHIQNSGNLYYTGNPGKVEGVFEPGATGQLIKTN